MTAPTPLSEPASRQDEPLESSSKISRLKELGRVFFRLGCTSFGGPVAHLGYFQTECVRRRRWMEETEFADVVALCQFLPGPSSSQVVFALGFHRAGLAGAFVASVFFLLPSMVLMTLFAYGVLHLGDWSKAGWLHGLKLAAVAVVAQAVWNMGRRLCPDAPRLLLALLAAVVVLWVPGALGQISVIVAGGLAGWLIYRHHKFSDARSPSRLSSTHFWAGGTLIAFAVLLFALPLLASTTGNKEMRLFDSFYRAGSLVFGGGHVILPLLRVEVVPPGWIGDDLFLAGYGAAQAVPGPLFSFAAYLGTVIHGEPHAWLGGLWCLFALFLPAWMLIGGALPFWHLLRSRAWAQAALRGANAAVVGLLLAALYTPVGTEGIHHARDIIVVLVAYALLEMRRVPPWIVVIGAGLAGQWLV